MTVTANAPEISAADLRALIARSGLPAFLALRCVRTHAAVFIMRCTVCDKGFSPKHPRGRFCSSRCRLAAWQQRRAQAQADEKARVRMLLREALELLEEP